ncbi:hypothetical protein FOA52_007447 [Chlamydomonas sp. UWO 241]|nr:hypothetical protein FOA52_007447 [Chlamydomonas sp. UWO 241]
MPIFRQLLEPESSTYTYLLADASTKEAVIIDPVDVTCDRDLKLIEEMGLKLIYAINTHAHADHITGTGLIKQRVPGVKSGIAKASGAMADIYFEPNETFKFGAHMFKVLATPGHTAGCVTYFTESNGGMAFTGDAILVRGCGRTDFQGGCSETLYDSVHNVIFKLPGTTVLYPAHDYKGHHVTTVAEEMEHNPRLTKSKADFVTLMDGLNLPYPKKIDASLPANMACGFPC